MRLKMLLSRLIANFQFIYQFTCLFLGLLGYKRILDYIIKLYFMYFYSEKSLIQYNKRLGELY